MSGIDKSDIEHVAKLSKLTLTESEKEKFEKQLSGIIDYISELKEVDTDGVEPTSQCTGLEDIYREDTIKTENVLSNKDALSGTEKTHNGYFMVDAILQERKHK
jgi:aspartyl-tRNA(Asn)/glutamyl-tRNA(Gln) amidotransferase subunit C